MNNTFHFISFISIRSSVNLSLNISLTAEQIRLCFSGNKATGPMMVFSYFPEEFYVYICIYFSSEATSQLTLSV